MGYHISICIQTMSRDAFGMLVVHVLLGLRPSIELCA